jgi:hypothetical protein
MDCFMAVAATAETLYKEHFAGKITSLGQNPIVSKWQGRSGGRNVSRWTAASGRQPNPLGTIGVR